MKALLSLKRFPNPPGPRSRYRKLPIVGPILDDVLAWLSNKGYAESTLRNHIIGISRIIRWLSRRKEPTLKEITQLDLDSAYDWFHKRNPNVAGVAHKLARYFRQQQLIPEGKIVPLPISERELQAHGAYLRTVRGLAELTIEGHKNRLRYFLKFLKYDRNPDALRTLQLCQVEAFLRKSAQTNNRFSLQHIVASLRSFLQRQYAQGIIPKPLHQYIDTPRTYRLEQLPRALPWEQVVALLRSIDRSQSANLRDFTLLYLAARYGLRSGEIVRLKLDDIDWRAGVLNIPQTKTRQILRLPLTTEAGDIIAQYLKIARPTSSFRELFLRRRAPMGPLGHTAVHDILELRLQQSGLKLPKIGTHALRHSLAIHLLRRGVPLTTIGNVLGHRDAESTCVYLRLAVDDLREVGLPVPQCKFNARLDPIRWKSKLPRVRSVVSSPLSNSDFQSGLQTALKQYLATRHALGRSYAVEEAVLRRWDDFLYREYGLARQVRSEMFHRWAQSLPQFHPTVHRNHLRIVRNFLLFHSRQHPHTFIPDVATFPKPSPHRPPRLISAVEMARILSSAYQLSASHQNPLRPETMRLALLLLFCCGLRRGELLRLQWRHCDLQEDILHIEATKFHKSRLVPLSKSAGLALHQYWTLRQRRNIAVQPTDYVIWSNNPIAMDQVYSASALIHNWRFLCLATGTLDERGHPPHIHDLRHSCAVTILERWYKTGTNLNTKLPHLATYLGHINPVSTHYYLHLTPELQQSASRRYHEYAFHVFTEGGPL